MSEVRIVPESDGASGDEAVRVLRDGGLVCYPTDTVYGIGAAAGDDAAVRRLFAVKGRSPDKPLPLLLADVSDAARVAEVTPLARALATRFWPGALTIVMRKAVSYRSLALAGGDTVALRVPDHELVRRIVRALGEPITGTSANRSGTRAPISAAEVAFQMGEMVELIIDGGQSRTRLESTVIDITRDKPEIVREGAVSRGEVEKALGQVVRAKA
ncbi:MAG: threonylcarbamoyl-AMP synthase [Chloroflexi bacterium]|nr:threonylcarbamoyl-AMP synthase [Chloroflexota bacterium]